MFNPKQAGGGGGGGGGGAESFLCCAEKVSSRKLKLCHFYYIQTGDICWKPLHFDIRHLQKEGQINYTKNI